MRFILFYFIFAPEPKMLLRQEVERRKLAIIRKLLGLGLAEINGQTLDQLTLTQLEGILIASLQVLEGSNDAQATNNL